MIKSNDVLVKVKKNNIELLKNNSNNYLVGVNKIEDYALKHFHNLEEIKIPNNVKEIGFGAFIRCAELKKVVLPQGLELINVGAFSYCENLEEIEIPQGVKNISSSAFLNCISLRKVTLPDGLEIIDDSAFGYCTNLEEIEIPSSVTKISCRAFHGCTGLREVTLPLKFKGQEKELFENWYNIEFTYIEDANENGNNYDEREME